MAQVNAAELDIRIDRKAYVASSGASTRVAIKDLKLSVLDSEFLCIVGPSGCGKTTLLNIIAGIDDDANGTIVAKNDQPLDSIRISYMFQTPRLLPWMTVRENVRVVMDDATVENGKAEQLLGRMELSDSLDEFPNRLSGGMQRRVALARAFATEPQLLLLDEPFVSLDMPVGNLLRQLLLDLWQTRPTTVIFVTHDLREAIYLSDRIIFLSRGPSRVILDKPVDLPRPREVEDPRIDQFRQNLLSEHDSVLHGVTSGPLVGKNTNNKTSSEPDLNEEH